MEEKQRKINYMKEKVKMDVVKIINLYYNLLFLYIKFML